MNIGKKVREIRKKRDIPVSQIAASAGLDETMIYKIESNDAKPSLPALERICAALGVTMAEFFTEGVDKPHEVERRPAVTEAIVKKIESLPPDQRKAVELIIDCLAAKQ